MTEAFRRRLKEELEGPKLSSPLPAQARYRNLGGAVRSDSVGLIQLGAAFLVGVLVAVGLISAGTHSANPQVWRVQVAAAFRQLTTTPTATPSPAESASPTASPRGFEIPGIAPTPEESMPGSNPAEGPETPGPTNSEQPEPAPSASSSGGGGEAPEPQSSPESSWNPSPSPASSPEADH
jgi:hypothetical protein